LKSTVLAFGHANPAFEVFVTARGRMKEAASATGIAATRAREVKKNLEEIMVRRSGCSHSRPWLLYWSLRKSGQTIAHAESGASMFSCNLKASQGYGCHQNQDLSCRQDDVGAEPPTWLECENSVMGGESPEVAEGKRNAIGACRWTKELLV